MYSHLVSVEVGVESGTYERMELDGTAFYEYRLECLDGKSVERRSTVEENGVIHDDLFEDIPDLRYSFVYLLSCSLDVELVVDLNELLDYEGLEELKSHLLRETALMHLKFRSDDDNGTSGVVYTLTEEVLSETALLTLEHVRK